MSVFVSVSVFSEGTFDHGCVTLQHGGREIKNRCGLSSKEYRHAEGEGGGGLGGCAWIKYSPVIDCPFFGLLGSISMVLKEKMTK